MTVQPSCHSCSHYHPSEVCQPESGPGLMHAVTSHMLSICSNNLHTCFDSSCSYDWSQLLPHGMSASADASKEDGIVHGATSLLRAQSLFRAVSRQPSALAGLVTALMAGSQYSSPQAQQSILECYLLFALRFIRPPQLAAAQAGSLMAAVY